MYRPMITTEATVLARARAEVVRMRRTFELRESAPSHVSRAWCQDCETVVELVRAACPCGSHSVVPHGARRAA
jgi:hypothetical protein